MNLFGFCKFIMSMYHATHMTIFIIVALESACTSLAVDLDCLTLLTSVDITNI